VVRVRARRQTLGGAANVAAGIRALGAANRLRVYNAEKFAVAARFLTDRGWPLVLLGRGVEDEAYAASLIQAIGRTGDGGILNFISRLSVAESFRVILSAAFFVGAESGMWNAAYALDKPAVVLYGGGDYGGFLHKDPKIRDVTAGTRPCFQCRWRCTRRNARGGAPCVDDIAPAQITEALQVLLDGEDREVVA
jgi:ADP-heptose:LPS heptosyltransferase